MVLSRQRLKLYRNSASSKVASKANIVHKMNSLLTIAFFWSTCYSSFKALHDSKQNRGNAKTILKRWWVLHLCREHSPHRNSRVLISGMYGFDFVIDPWISWSALVYWSLRSFTLYRLPPYYIVKFAFLCLLLAPQLGVPELFFDKVMHPTLESASKKAHPSLLRYIVR